MDTISKKFAEMFLVFNNMNGLAIIESNYYKLSIVANMQQPP